jgi:hypothetical protein
MVSCIPTLRSRALPEVERDRGGQDRAIIGNEMTADPPPDSPALGPAGACDNERLTVAGL